MKKILLPVLLLIGITSFGQKKIKTAKNPIGWQYQVAPLTPLPEHLKHYSIEVDTDLDPLDFWDEVNLGMQLDIEDRVEKQVAIDRAHQDTIDAWTKKYMELKKYPLARTYSNPDFTIKLTTDTFAMENVQVDIDYSDQESVLGKINVAARLEVRDAQDQILMDDKIVYLLDDRDGPSNLLRLRHLFFNPSFKLKFKLTKKPEKKKKLLEKRVAKYESEILEFFIEEAGKRLTNQFLPQKLDAYAAAFGIKGKEHEEVNSWAETMSKNINLLNSFSKKKRKSLKAISPELEKASAFWKNKLESASEVKTRDIFNYNAAICLLFLNDLEKAKTHAKKITEFDQVEQKTIFTGNFNYYLKGLKDALDTIETFGDRATIYHP